MLRFHGRGQGHVRATSAGTGGSTSCRRRSCACCCRSSTGGRTAAARPARTTPTPASASRRAARRNAGRGARVAPVRRAPRRADALDDALNGAGVGARGYYRTPLHGRPRWPRGRRPPTLPVTDELARTHLAIPMNRVLDARRREVCRGRARRSRVRCAMRVWIDLTNSPHVLVMRPVIDGAARRRRTRCRSPRATSRRRSRCASGSGSSTPSVGHHRGGKLAAKGLGLVQRSGALVRWARGHGASTSRSATAPTTSPSLPRCCGSRAHDVRLRVGDRPAHGQLSARAGGRRAGGDPARAARALRRDASKLQRYAGLKEEYYLADFEPDPAVLEELSLDAAQPIVVVRTPPVVSLYHRFEHDTFGAVLARLRDEAPRRSCCRARPSSAPS